MAFGYIFMVFGGQHMITNSIQLQPGGGPMKFKVNLVIVLVVTVSLGLSACGGSQPAPSIGGVDITGVWKRSGAIFLQLNEDGTYAFADVGPDFLEKAPFDAGTFRLEGTMLTFITSDESALCAGQSGSYQVELTEEGQLQFELQEDACDSRAEGIPIPLSWERVEP
jgi:hypothetical protein